MKTIKISIYELLGLIKDGKAPKKIKYCDCIYELEEDWYLTKEKNYKLCLGGKSEDINQLYNAFNDNVEILDEEDEFEDIEEKDVYMDFSCDYWKQAQIDELADTLTRYELAIKKIIRNQKKIIERLKDE